MMNMAQLAASQAVAENPNARVSTGINPMIDPLAAMTPSFEEQEQMKLQGRGVQQPTYQTGGINPKFAGVAAGVMGDITARNNSTFNLV
tara:strand:+ start:7264 stop:7530 length:267 start_codon:yes stop_codon:yes gene_type:complete